MIFSKGHIWRAKKTDIVEKYRCYLQNAAGSDTFVDHLLTAFAKDLADEKGSNDVVARAVFAGSPENRYNITVVEVLYPFSLKQVKPSRLDGDLPKDGNAKCIGLIQALD